MPTSRALRRALRRLSTLYVTAFVWAASVAAAQLLPIGLIARVVLVITVVIALYALTAAFIVFVACGRFGIVRAERWRSQTATIAVIGSFAWILGSAWHEGRTPLNLTAIAAAEVSGVAVYVGRRSVLAAARRRVAVDR